jgi:D-sedoheptulose 7-phosphate isomerase
MDRIEEILRTSAELKVKLVEQAPVIKKMADIVSDALKNKKGVYLFGNGGSAADAQHIAAEMQGRFLKERPALPVITFTANTSTLTAVANDYSYKLVFTRQVEAFVERGDVVIAISTSGNSPNVVDALRLARARGAVTLGLGGETGGKMAAYCDTILKVPSKETPRIQECHVTIGHIICELVEAALFPDK